MKRTLLSLAAMAVARAPSRQPVSVFGTVDATAATLTPSPRLGALLNDPDPDCLREIREACMALLRSPSAGSTRGAPEGSFWLGADYGARSTTVAMVGAHRLGKTASLVIYDEHHPLMPDATREALAQAAAKHPPMLLQPWQEEVARRTHEVPTWGRSWPDHYGAIPLKPEQP